jgi:hypothetical protein
MADMRARSSVGPSGNCKDGACRVQGASIRELEPAAARNRLTVWKPRQQSVLIDPGAGGNEPAGLQRCILRSTPT